MKCPYCGEDMKEGYVEVRDGSEFINLGIGIVISWMPRDEIKRIIRKNAVHLATKGEGYYCEKCHKAVAVLNERGDDFFQ
ncbi:MAG: hypothetical protein E7258_05690 [Lachnospiraceae bacterium]|nr:hypothetical protein [Lachnospiraceae bacterium]